jgi:hypothetical protein
MGEADAGQRMKFPPERMKLGSITAHGFCAGLRSLAMLGFYRSN